MLRYLALVCDANNAEHVQALQSCKALLTTNAPSWSIACSAPNLLVLYKSTMPDALEIHRLHDSGGVVLGAVFERFDSDNHVAITGNFSPEDSKSVLYTGGRDLVRRYFGAYVAFLHEPNEGRDCVFREPTGNLPCYRTARGGVHIFFSHVEDCVRGLRLDFEIDRDHFTRWLVYANVLSSRCSLRDVENVLPGERLMFCRGNIARDRIWNAQTFATTKRAGGVEEAARSLREIVQTSVNAWASRYSTIALKLSGGLDSSIVAGCLAHAPNKPKVTCLNFQTGNRDEHMHLPSVPDEYQTRVRAVNEPGDERVLARLVAQRWGMPLTEHKRNRAMDLRALSHVPLSVDPAVYFSLMDVDEIEVAHVEAHGTQAFFSGQNGDAVFMATRRPFAAMDYAYLHGLSSDLRAHISNGTKGSGYSFWDVAGQALWHGALRRPYPPGDGHLQRPNLLPTQTLEALGEEDFQSPFTGMLSNLPPGKLFHASAAGAAAYHRFIFKGGHLADYIDPLNSQPVWELVLQLPTYYLAHNGVSRGLARMAFADILPDQIRKRQVKGVGAAFYQDVVNRNRLYLKDRLLQGLLVRENYLDGRAIEQCLSAEYPSALITSSTLLSYLAAEIWMEHWNDVRLAAAA